MLAERASISGNEAAGLRPGWGRDVGWSHGLDEEASPDPLLLAPGPFSLAHRIQGHGITWAVTIDYHTLKPFNSVGSSLT